MQKTTEQGLEARRRSESITRRFLNNCEPLHEERPVGLALIAKRDMNV